MVTTTANYHIDGVTEGGQKITGAATAVLGI